MLTGAVVAGTLVLGTTVVAVEVGSTDVVAVVDDAGAVVGPAAVLPDGDEPPPQPTTSTSDMATSAASALRVSVGPRSA